ncbi:hypothetical protein BV327_03663 [Pseudomonas syringae pv. actinidiae]|nr:hypothetical protein BV327_03663 [Pseudomonas syringae pv. actinidiae]
MLTCVTWNTQGSNGVEKSVESLLTLPPRNVSLNPVPGLSI